MIENSVVDLEGAPKSGKGLTGILTDMAQNEYLAESQDLSIKMSNSISASTAEISPNQRGVGQANLWVLNGAFMPSVLVEASFICNPDEEKLLASKAFRKKIATALCNSVVSFRRKYEGL